MLKSQGLSYQQVFYTLWKYGYFKTPLKLKLLPSPSGFPTVKQKCKHSSSHICPGQIILPEGASGEHYGFTQDGADTVALLGFALSLSHPLPLPRATRSVFLACCSQSLNKVPKSSLPLYSLRFESGAWPCSRWAGSFPRAPFLLLCFGSGILEALGLSLCLPLCLHLSTPWEGVSPYVCALLFPHLLCWSVHDFPLFAEVFSALPSRARPPCPLYSHTVQKMASPMLEQGSNGLATIIGCCGSWEAWKGASPMAGACCLHRAWGWGWRCPTPSPGTAYHASVSSLAQPSLKCHGGHAVPVLSRESQRGSG